MAQQTDTQLQTLADQIKNEATPGANTAVRVGTLLGDFVDSKLNTGSVSVNTSLGTDDSLVPSQNAVRTYVTNTAATLNANISNVSLALNNMSYSRVYAATLTQDGTPGRIPAAAVIKNTLTFTPTWIYFGQGQYYINQTFDVRSTTFSIGGSQIYSSGIVTVYSNRVSGNSIQIWVNTISDPTQATQVDGVLFNTPIEIHVY